MRQFEGQEVQRELLRVYPVLQVWQAEEFVQIAQLEMQLRQLDPVK